MHVFTQETINVALQGFQNGNDAQHVSLLFLSWLYFYVHGLCGHTSGLEICRYLRSAPWETRSEFWLPFQFADNDVRLLFSDELSENCSFEEAWIGLMDMWRFQFVQLFLHFNVTVTNPAGANVTMPAVYWTEESFPPALIEKIAWGPLEWFSDRHHALLQVCHKKCVIKTHTNDNYILFGIASLLVPDSSSSERSGDWSSVWTSGEGSGGPPFNDIFCLKLNNSAQSSRQHMCTLVWTKMQCAPLARKTRNMHAGDTYYVHSNAAGSSRSSGYEQGLLNVSKLRLITRAVDPAVSAQSFETFSCGLSSEFLLPHDLSCAAPLPDIHPSCDECVYVDPLRNNKTVHYFCAKMYITNRRQPVSGPCGTPIVLHISPPSQDNTTSDVGADAMVEVGAGAMEVGVESNCSPVHGHALLQLSTAPNVALGDFPSDCNPS